MENSVISIEPFAKSTLDFIDELRKRGVYRFEGYGLKLELGDLPVGISREPPPPQRLIDLGGGIMVSEEEARDLGLPPNGDS